MLGLSLGKSSTFFYGTSHEIDHEDTRTVELHSGKLRIENSNDNNNNNNETTLTTLTTTTTTTKQQQQQHNETTKQLKHEIAHNAKHYLCYIRVFLLGDFIMVNGQTLHHGIVEYETKQTHLCVSCFSCSTIVCWCWFLFRLRRILRDKPAPTFWSDDLVSERWARLNIQLRDPDQILSLYPQQQIMK